MSKITLFGAGRMGSALAAGWLSAKPSSEVTLIEPHPSERVQNWASEGLIRLNPLPEHASHLVVAIKPQVFPEFSGDLQAFIGPETEILSVMAGVSLATLEARLNTPKVARAMPNTPGMIGKGVTLLCTKADTSATMVSTWRSLLEPLGTVEGPLDESLLPAATAVSGCGPAYGFLLVELMAQAGIASGLPSDLAQRLARKTVEGAGALLAASEESAATLRQNVTSPNGVTQAALEVLMADEATPAQFRAAIKAAIARDKALAEETA